MRKEALITRGVPLPLLLRYREAAHELGVTERQILNLINRKLLERVKVGSKTARVTRDSVLKLVEKNAAK
jgi:excisionase family DNA binding protein